jgi:glutathione S-transferase/GST-like protein
VRHKEPAELRDAIDRIPLKERRIAWSKAIYNTFSEQELTESRRRSKVGIAALEKRLSESRWITGDAYSLADINAFNLAYALPLVYPEVAGDTHTPNMMAWLRAIYARPATKQCWAMGKTQMASRVSYLEGGPK